MKVVRPRKPKPDPPAPLWHRPELTKVDPPARGVDVASYWREHLPKPPGGSQDDAEVAGWIDDVAHVGGAPALGWLRSAENWPRSLGPALRSRLQYYVVLLADRLNEAAKREALRQTQDNIDRQAEERRRVQHEQGW